MKQIILVVLTLTFLGTAFAMADSARGRAQDAWSAAERLEKDALKLQPWDPDSFRHPEQYDIEGKKISKPKKRTQ